MRGKVRMCKADRDIQEASDAATWDAIVAYRDTGEMVPVVRDGQLAFLTVDETLRERGDYDRRRREDAEWKRKNLVEQFAAAGVELTDDVWDRLEADRRQAFEDEMLWIRGGTPSSSDS